MSANLDVIYPGAIDLDQIHDTTLRQKIEATIAENRVLRQNYRLAQREAQFKSHFLARISHELRSPLSGIIGSHQLVLEDLCEDIEEEHDFVHEANKAALKLVRMLDSLLLVSRIEAGRRPPKIQPLTLHQLFQAVCEPIKLEAANYSVSFQTDLDDPEVTIATDKDLLISLVIDLLELAIDLSHNRETSVKLTCRSHSDTVEFWLDSALLPADFGDPLDFWEHHISTDHLTFKRATVKQGLPVFSLSPSLRLTLNQLLLELMGGDVESPTPIYPEQPTLTRLRFWLPRALSPSL